MFSFVGEDTPVIIVRWLSLLVAATVHHDYTNKETEVQEKARCSPEQRHGSNQGSPAPQSVHGLYFPHEVIQ